MSDIIPSALGPKKTSVLDEDEMIKIEEEEENEEKDDKERERSHSKSKSGMSRFTKFVYKLNKKKSVENVAVGIQSNDNKNNDELNGEQMQIPSLSASPRNVEINQFHKNSNLSSQSTQSDNPPDPVNSSSISAENETENIYMADTNNTHSLIEPEPDKMNQIKHKIEEKEEKKEDDIFPLKIRNAYIDDDDNKNEDEIDLPPLTDNDKEDKEDKDDEKEQEQTVEPIKHDGYGNINYVTVLDDAILEVIRLIRNDSWRRFKS